MTQPTRPYDGQASARLAVLALALGIAALVPLAGILAVLPALITAALVLGMDQPGKRLAGAGIALAVVGVLLQVSIAFYLAAAPACTPVGAPAPWGIRAPTPTPAPAMATLSSAPANSPPPVLPAATVRAMLVVGAVELRRTPDAAKAAKLLQEARRLYDARDSLPGNYYHCMRRYQLHLAYAERTTFADARDAQQLQSVQWELAGKVAAQYQKAASLHASGDYAQVVSEFQRLQEIVPAETGPEAKASNDLAENIAGHLTWARMMAAATQPATTPAADQDK